MPDRIDENRPSQARLFGQRRPSVLKKAAAELVMHREWLEVVSKPMRVLISGATGFVGRALVERLLARGDEVTAFTRNASKAPAVSGLRFVSWTPLRAGDWQAEVEGKDAIVHLAGEPVGGRRFTEATRREILDSRVAPAELLASAVERAAQRPSVFVSASGVGYYGSHEDASELDESSPAGSDFLAQVCVAWEDAARRFETYGMRAVSLRFGLVLGREGGALPRMLPAFKWFAGGKLGHGRQVMPWVHLEDAVLVALKALDDVTLSGPVNVTAPRAVSNAEFTRVLGYVLQRPTIMPVPSLALRALFGEGAEPLLGGQNAVPKALLDRGFVFRYPELEKALRNLLAAG